MTAAATRAPLAAALAEAAAAREPTEAEQLSMLPVPRTLDDGRADRVRQAVKLHREAGRPPGARNLATRETLKFVREVLGDPVIERARMAMHTPDSLSLWLGCSKFEAAQFLDGIRADLSKLFYAPLAAVDDKGNAVVPSFHMSIGGGAPGAAAGDREPWLYLEAANSKTQQNGAFSEVADDVSHDAVSHETPK